ncbi:MAG: ferrochelatase [Myxococcales bacterium]|nr:ferrochelatase [Myxococcales bacterium]
MIDLLTGVVLLNMGGPDSLDAVEPFLFNLFNDNDIIPLPLGGLLIGQRLLARRISSRRAEFVRGYYRLIGGRSPIADITSAQAAALEERLNSGARGRYRCYVAMRYWHPFTDETLAAMQKDGVRRVVALTLYPHYTTATTGSSLNELRRRIAGKPPGLGAIDVIEIDRFYDDPGYLDALTAQLRAGLSGFPEAVRPGVMVLFSAHGLPRSFIRKGDPYVEHLLATIAGVTARLAATEGRVQPWRLAYQSRVGKGWLEPGTDDMLRTLAAEGHREVLVVPLSFVSDHIETLYEIDLLFGEQAQKLGLDMRRAPSLNTDPGFIQALASLVERRLTAQNAARGL